MTKFENINPESQSIEAVKAMAAALGKPIGEALPEAVKMSRDVYLVLSANMDRYYTTTRKHGCSCPASFYHPDRPCKHQRHWLKMQPARTDSESILAKAPSFRPVLDEAVGVAST